MAYRIDKERRKNPGTGTKLSRMEVPGQIIEYLLAAVTLAVCVVVPLYARDGYHQIGNAKFDAYRRIMIGGFSVLLILAIVYFLSRLIYGSKSDADQTWRSAAAHITKSERSQSGNSQLENSGRLLKGQVSLTDMFVIAYLILTGISVFSGGFYKNALWGSNGWNMGLMSQLSFVLLYLFLSRFGKYYRVILIVLCSVASVVFSIGILHRLLIDPIGFYDGLTYGQKAQFLSTPGQATWYASFLAVTLPLGIGVFLYAEGIVLRILSSIYMILGFCTLVTQNSDSAYFALAGALLVFFMISCERRETLCRFTAALSLFFASGKIMYFLTRMRPNPELEPDFVTELMWTSGLTWVLLGIFLGLTLIIYIAMVRDGHNCASFLFRHKHSMKSRHKGETSDCTEGNRMHDCSIHRYPESVVHWIHRGTMGIVIVLAVLTVSIIGLQSRGVLPTGISDKISTISYLNWDSEWGNGRGRIWSFSCRVISQENLKHRIFGVGPDCFSSYVKAYHGEEEKLLWGEKLLTNAHNEWLNMLINGGALGAVAYLGIYVTAIGRFLRGRAKDFLLTGIAAACVSYMCYNFFCYQQVLCTPFVFILMGIGEYILRNSSAME